MFDSSRRSFRSVADVFLLLLVGFPVLLLNLAGRPFERGFFCDDDSIRYPYRESTIPTRLLVGIGLLLPAALIALAEWATAKYHRRGRGSDVWFREWYHHSVAFFFGAGCTQLLTDAAKHTIGRLRPHFFAVCSPNVDCDDPRMRHAYVEDFECRGENVRLIEDARLSFPSGHSSLAAYSMVFLAMYCGARLIRDDFRLVKHVLQFCAIVAAVYTGLTRISDYKHHWSDVLAGLVLGTVTAILTVVFVSEPVSRRMCKASPTEACPDDDEGDGGYDAI